MFCGLVFLLSEYRTLVQNLSHWLVFKRKYCYFFSMKMFPILRGFFHCEGCVHLLPVLALLRHACCKTMPQSCTLIDSKVVFFLIKKKVCS